MNMQLPIFLVILFALLFLDRYFRHFLARQIILLGFHLFNSHRAGLAIYALLFFPGTLIHEMAHLLTAVILGLGVGRVQLIPDKIAIDEPLGSVEVEAGKPWRLSFVGIAPFFWGLAALLAIVSFMTLDGFNPVGANVFNRLTEPSFYWQLLTGFFTNLDSWLSVLLLYLAISVSNHMYPSKADLRYWPFQIITVVLLAIGWYLLNRFDWFGLDPLGFTFQVLPLVFIVFVFTICLNLFGGALLWLLNKVIVKIKTGDV